MQKRKSKKTVSYTHLDVYKRQSESSTPTEEAAQPVSCIVKLKNETIEVKAEAPAGVLPNGTQMIVKAVENNTEDAAVSYTHLALLAKRAAGYV